MTVPAPFILRSYGGGADAAQLVENIGPTDTQFAITTTVGWTEADGNPLGTAGPFTVIIDRFTNTVEKITCSSVNLTTGVVTVDTTGGSGRGADGTTGQAHVPGGSTSGVQTCWTSVEAAEANMVAAYILGQLGGTPTTGDVLAWGASAPVWGSLTIPVGAWVSYTPTWTAQSSDPSLGNGTLTGFYQKLGRMVAVRICLTTGSTSGYGSGDWFVGLPFAAAATSEQDLLVKAYVNAQQWAGTAVIPASSTTAQPTTSTSATDTRLVSVGAGNPDTWTTSNVLVIQGVYESAT